MSTFGGLILTNKGKTLQSKAQAGVALNYTRIALGDGTLGTTSILSLNSLIREVKSLNITKLKVLSGGRAVVGSVLSNQDLNTGFYWREIGVFAQDPDLGEVLYCYANAGDLAEYIPPGGGSDIIEKTIDVQTLVGNATNVTATVDESLVFATYSQLVALEQSVNEHQADDVNHVRYGVATGSANAYAVTLNPAPTTYAEGMAVSLKINADSTAASTLNVNGLGAKGIKKSNGTDVTNLKANGIYTFRYDGTNFILQGEGGSGNAVASDLLSGKTATTDAGDIVGTMVDRGAYNVTPGAASKTIPAGYHNGSGTVSGDADLIAANIKSGINIFGVNGNLVPIAAGNNLIHSNVGEQTTGSLSFTKLKSTVVAEGGTYRISFDLRNQSGMGYTVGGRIYVNGISRGTLRTNASAGYITYTEDITLNANDEVQIYAYAHSSAWVYVNNLRFYSTIGFNNVM